MLSSLIGKCLRAELYKSYSLHSIDYRYSNKIKAIAARDAKYRFLDIYNIKKLYSLRIGIKLNITVSDLQSS